VVALKKDFILILTILLLPLLLRSSFVVSVATIAVIYSILSLSWFFMEKEAGWASLAHSIPFGIAAYALAINPTLLILAFLLSLLLFAALSLSGREKFVFTSFITAVVFWYLSHYITLSVNGEIVGGEEGFSFQSIGIWESYLLSSSMLLLFFASFALIRKSGLGLKIEAVRDDEIAARSIGIDAFKIRIVSFTISVITATVAGLCYLLYFGHVSPEIFSVEVALLPFVASLIAGNRWLSPVVGSYTVVIVSRAFSGILPEAHLLLYAAVLILSPKLKGWWSASAD
jgi:branched-chain amino acid transport system permease protein